jgi:hypothetical protein
VLILRSWEYCGKSWIFKNSEIRSLVDRVLRPFLAHFISSSLGSPTSRRMGASQQAVFKKT